MIAAEAAAEATAWAAAGDAKEAAWAAAGDAAWKRTIADANEDSAGLPPVDLARRRLWVGSPPDDFSVRWRELKQILYGLGDGWEVWTDWYEDRLAGEVAGRPLIPELELDRILVPDFDAAPAVVNATIAALEEKYRNPPPVTPPTKPTPPSPNSIPPSSRSLSETTANCIGHRHAATARREPPNRKTRCVRPGGRIGRSWTPWSTSIRVATGRR